MDLFIQLIEALVWPVTILILSLLFRRELRQAATRLSRFTFGNFEASFENDLEDAEEEVNALTRELKSDSTLLHPNATVTIDRFYRIADISPKAAIMEAWREIEIATRQVAERYGIPVSGRIAGTNTIRDLIERGLLPHRLLPAYSKLRKVRSNAAHVDDFQIEENEAERYLDTAYRFLQTLALLLSEAPAGAEDMIEDE